MKHSVDIDLCLALIARETRTRISDQRLGQELGITADGAIARYRERPERQPSTLRAAMLAVLKRFNVPGMIELDDVPSLDTPIVSRNRKTIVLELSNGQAIGLLALATAGMAVAKGPGRSIGAGRVAVERLREANERIASKCKADTE